MESLLRSKFIFSVPARSTGPLPSSLRTIVQIGCVKSVREGGGGQKKPENLGTYFMDAP